MSDPAPQTDGSVHEAAAALNALFSPAEPAKPDRPRDEKGKFINPKTPKPITPADGSPDPDAPKPKAEESEDDEQEGDAEDEEASDEQEAQDEDGEAEDAQPAKKGPTVKVKVDGIEQELPLDEVAKGYSRTADYTRKTQALADERKRFEAEEREPVRQERAVYAERLAQLEEVVQSLMPDREPDWAALRNEMTPDQFTQVFADWRSQAQRMEKIRAERERIAALQRDDDDKARQSRLVSEFAKLQEALPDLKDPEKGKVLAADLRAYANSLGYPEQALDAVEDHQLIVMLNKARLWDQSQLRKPKLEEKVDRVLESVKPSNVKPRPKTSEVEQVSKRLKESGRVEDAAWLINQRLARSK